MNDVFGVSPGGRPWVISRLDADVRGRRIRVEGRGLILAGGNNIGTSGSGQTVQARLNCGGVPHNSALVPLELDGDFRIDSALTPTPPVLARLRSCSSSVAAVAGSRPGFRRTSKRNSPRSFAK